MRLLNFTFIIIPQNPALHFNVQLLLERKSFRHGRLGIFFGAKRFFG